MGGVVRKPAVIDSAGVVRVAVPQAPLRTERFTAEGIQKPADLANQLTRMQRQLDEAHGSAHTNPFAGSVVFEGLAAPGGGARLTIQHGLGRKPRWVVVGWSGAGTTGPPTLVEDSKDESRLVLRSYVSGTLDVMVF